MGWGNVWWGMSIPLLCNVNHESTNVCVDIYGALTTYHIIFL